jgi:hypothetical protein
VIVCVRSGGSDDELTLGALKIRRPTSLRMTLATGSPLRLRRQEILQADDGDTRGRIIEKSSASISPRCKQTS